MVSDAHKSIRNIFNNNGFNGSNISILYGGSVTDGNAIELSELKDLDLLNFKRALSRILLNSTCVKLLELRIKGSNITLIWKLNMFDREWCCDKFVHLQFQP